MANAYFDARGNLEQRLWVAQNISPVLLAYWLGRPLDEIEANIEDAIDESAAMLFFLLRRPLFREVVRVEGL